MWEFRILNGSSTSSISLATGAILPQASETPADTRRALLLVLSRRGRSESRCLRQLPSPAAAAARELWRADDQRDVDAELEVRHLLDATKHASFNSK